jgi:hypothetical protein
MIETNSEQSNQSDENSESESLSEKDDERSETNRDTLNEENLSNNSNRLPDKSENQITSANDLIAAENDLQTNLADTDSTSALLESKYSKKYLIFNLYLKVFIFLLITKNKSSTKRFPARLRQYKGIL